MQLFCYDQVQPRWVNFSFLSFFFFSEIVHTEDILTSLTQKPQVSVSPLLRQNGAPQLLSRFPANLLVHDLSIS